MKFALPAATIGLVSPDDPGHPGRRNQGLRHRRGARAPSKRSPRNSSAPPATSWSPTSTCRPTLIKKIDPGEPYDVIILSYDVEALIKQGKVVANSRTVFGRVGVGIAVRQGAPKPDFSTVEAFKRSLLAAKTIATSGEGSSGRYVVTLLDRLGIAEQIKPKIRSGNAGASAEMVSRGEVDFVVSGLPPVIGTPGIESLGYLPEEINSWLVFSGGIGVNAKEPDGRARPC